MVRQLTVLTLDFQEQDWQAWRKKTNTHKKRTRKMAHFLLQADSNLKNKKKMWL